jgi:hypothetical protein
MQEDAMGASRVVMTLGLLVLAVTLLSSASYRRQVVGMDVASFIDRDVLVVRTSGDVPVPNTYNRDEVHATVSFLLKNVGADHVTAPAHQASLIDHVSLDRADPTGCRIDVMLTSPLMTDPGCLRFSQPSEHLIVVEVFASEDIKLSAEGIAGSADQFSLTASDSAAAATTPLSAPQPAEQVSKIDQLGIPVVDLSDAEPERILGLAAASGLLDIHGDSLIITENMGNLQVKPAGQGVASWSKESPPGELYLSGTPDQIAHFLSMADSAMLARQPTIEQVWIANRPRERQSSKPTLGSSGGAYGKPRLLDDPHAGLYYAAPKRSGGMLSDVRVTLTAMSGMNLYDVINYLSLISGISIMIDPYTFEEPFGSRRAPLPPEDPQGGADEPGFRSAGIFDPQLGGEGTVIGNFVNVPFDTALRLILEVHELEFVVYEGNQRYPGSRYGGMSSSDSGSGGGDPYSKPIVLVTSRERLEQELSGHNKVDLYQFHYADPDQVTDILANLNMLPGTNTGWYIYQGSGGGGGLDDGGRGSGGSGGGSGGGVGGGAANAIMDTAKGGLVVYRGSSRQPVYDVVYRAVEQGYDVVRVVLPHEESGQLVTGYSHP